MKKSTRILLWILLFIVVGIFVYQFLPIQNKIKLFEQPYVEGVLKGTVSNTNYKYVLVNLFEQDSTIFITEGKAIRSERLQVFDTVEIVHGAFSYTYRLKEPYFFPRMIYLANDSGDCEVVMFKNPYFNWPCNRNAICMDRGAEICLTIDGRNLQYAKIEGSLGTDAIFKRDAEENAKGLAARQALILKKEKASKRAKYVQDSIQNANKRFDSAIMRDRGRNTKIFLKPKNRQVQ